MFSKFHFCRLFQQVTGLPPGRFLAALRLVEAKRLLVSTSLSVTEISNQVGYSSVGTFSYRFKSMVGESPSFYRQLGDRSRRPVDHDVATSQLCPAAAAEAAAGLAAGPAPAPVGSTIHGDIRVPFGLQISHVFVGLFTEPVPQGRPVSCAVLDRPGSYTLDNVPEGRWYLMACARIEETVTNRAVTGQGPSLLLVSPRPVSMESATGVVQELDLMMETKRPSDIPALMNFPHIAAVTYFVDRGNRPGSIETDRFNRAS